MTADPLPASSGPTAYAATGIALQVRELVVEFKSDDGVLPAVDNVSFDLHKGRTLGLVGESGCGKSTLALAILGLVPSPGRISAGQANLDGKNILQLDIEAMRSIRGRRIGIIFQDPLTALNPVLTIGDQIAEVVRIHYATPRQEAWNQACEALAQVGIPDSVARAHAYPHQLSGGMRQRAMIAMALACRPDILIADEATTALDVTIQAQILNLLQDLQDSYGMAILFISHNLGVISEIADDILVMYAGRIVERSSAMALFSGPRHPYTQGLLETLPTPEARGQPLRVIPGAVPNLRIPAPGCHFAARCPIADDFCRIEAPPLPTGRHAAACYKATS